VDIENPDMPTTDLFDEKQSPDKSITASVASVWRLTGAEK